MTQLSVQEHLDEARNLLHFAVMELRNQDHTERQHCMKLSAALDRYFLDWPMELAKPENERGPGFLYVGVSEVTPPQVLVDLGRDRTGHVCFMPHEARNLAVLLSRKADEAEKGATQCHPT